MIFYHEIETAASGLTIIPMSRSFGNCEYQLRWLAGAGAETHTIYAGTNAAAVAAAKAGSPLCLGYASRPHLNQILTPGTCYHLRVDEVGADHRVTRGAVWSFTTPLL